MRLYILIVFFLIETNCHAQTVLDWADLSHEISWALPESDAIFPSFQKATFSAEIKALEGEQVVITGYFLVLDGKQSVYLLSKNPMASCFFCGNGGPETIVELHFEKKPAFEMDDLLSIQGTLHLNENDPNTSYYRIENADALSLK